MSEQNPVGHVINEVVVRAEQHNPAGKWVGADLALVTYEPPARYIVHVVTKSHFADEQIKSALNVDDTISDVLSGLSSEVVEGEPYVLNDEVLTDEVITAKFVGRTIMPDLAACLSPVSGPTV